MTSSTESLSPGIVRVGTVAGPHGVRGEIKVRNESNSPEFLTRFERFIIREEQLRVLSSRVHGGNLLVSLREVSDRNAAEALTGFPVYVIKEDAKLEPGEYFISDLIGLSATSENGKAFGTVSEYQTLPGHNVWVITALGDVKPKEILIPANPNFVREINPAEGYIRFRLIDGLMPD